MPAAVRSPHERPIATPRRRSTPAAGVKSPWRSRGSDDPSAEGTGRQAKGRDVNGFSIRNPAKTPTKGTTTRDAAPASTSKNPSKTPAAKSSSKKAPTLAARARSPLLAPRTNEGASRRRRRSPSPSPPPKRSRPPLTTTTTAPLLPTHEEIEWIPLTVQPPKGAAKGARGGRSRRYFAGFTRRAQAGGAAGEEFKVGDTVLLRAERSDLPPYVARLEALYEERAAPAAAAAAAAPRAEARCRWFYRPEDTDFAMKDPREIFYSHVRGVSPLPLEFASVFTSVFDREIE